MGGLPTPTAAAAIAERTGERPKRVNFVCVWVGDKYGPEYVAILRDMIARNASNLQHPCAWFCITDRPNELPEGIYSIPHDRTLPGWWAKLQMFSPKMPWDEGDRIVYFDLDVCITGRLEDLVERKGIIQDWHWPMFNSSVMVWDHGEHRQVWNGFSRDRTTEPAPPEIAKLLPAGEINAGDQHWITEAAPDWPTFPPEWFTSYRYAQSWPPSGCKAVVFHGHTKPADIHEGWVPNIWKLGGFTSLPEFRGVNTTEDQRLANVKVNVRRDLEWFTGFKDEGSTCVIVGGAPSMKDCMGDIAWHRRQKKTRIVTVNNAWRPLVERGITPDVHVMLDARPENAEFVKGAPKGVRFLLSAQCHPDVFDALEGHEVVVWFNGYDDNSKLQEILHPWWEGPDQKPIILVPGGSTVGLRALWLATYSGFRRIHMYGVDSSYAESGAHHAYPQALNDGESTLEVVRGDKRYVCAPWMVRQAAEFEQTWRDLADYVDFDGKPAPVQINVHGSGLIPDIARSLREEARRAAA